jgi:hypothetical protein
VSGSVDVIRGNGAKLLGVLRRSNLCTIKF